MALTKRNYVSGETTITAKNLNEIQDSIIALESNGGVTPHIGDNGNWYLGDTDTGKPSRGASGADGKSAYRYAVEGGYTGTEAEFAAKLAAVKLPNPNALTFTGAVTGSYDGSAPLKVEIPSGGDAGKGLGTLQPYP